MRVIRLLHITAVITYSVASNPQPTINPEAYCKALMGGWCLSGEFCSTLGGEMRLLFTNERTPSCHERDLARVQKYFSVLRQAPVLSESAENVVEGLKNLNIFSEETAPLDVGSAIQENVEQLEALVQLYVLSPGIEKRMKASFTTDKSTEGGITDTVVQEWLELFKSESYRGRLKQQSWNSMTDPDVEIRLWFENFSRSYLKWFEWFEELRENYEKTLANEENRLIKAREPGAGGGSSPLLEADQTQPDGENFELDDIYRQSTGVNVPAETTAQDAEGQYMQSAQLWIETHRKSMLRFIAKTISSDDISAMEQTKLLVVPTKLDANSFCKAVMGGVCLLEGHCGFYTSSTAQTVHCNKRNLAASQANYKLIISKFPSGLNLAESLVDFLESKKERGESLLIDDTRVATRQQLMALVELYATAPGIQKYIVASFAGRNVKIDDKVISELQALFEAGVETAYHKGLSEEFIRSLGEYQDMLSYPGRYSKRRSAEVKWLRKLATAVVIFLKDYDKRRTSLTQDELENLSGKEQTFFEAQKTLEVVKYLERARKWVDANADILLKLIANTLVEVVDGDAFCNAVSVEGSTCQNGFCEKGFGFADFIENRAVIPCGPYYLAVVQSSYRDFRDLFLKQLVTLNLLSPKGGATLDLMFPLNGSDKKKKVELTLSENLETALEELKKFRTATGSKFYVGDANFNLDSHVLLMLIRLYLRFPEITRFVASSVETEIAGVNPGIWKDAIKMYQSGLALPSSSLPKSSQLQALPYPILSGSQGEDRFISFSKMLFHWTGWIILLSQVVDSADSDEIKAYVERADKWIEEIALPLMLLVENACQGRHLPTASDMEVIDSDAFCNAVSVEGSTCQNGFCKKGYGFMDSIKGRKKIPCDPQYLATVQAAYGKFAADFHGLKTRIKNPNRSFRSIILDDIVKALTELNGFKSKHRAAMQISETPGSEFTWEALLHLVNLYRVFPRMKKFIRASFVQSDEEGEAVRTRAIPEFLDLYYCGTILNALDEKVSSIEAIAPSFELPPLFLAPSSPRDFINKVAHWFILWLNWFEKGLEPLEITEHEGYKLKARKWIHNNSLTLLKYIANAQAAADKDLPSMDELNTSLPPKRSLMSTTASSSQSSRTSDPTVTKKKCEAA